MKVSVLNVALNTMYNAEKRGKRQALIRPSSKVITKYLLVMQKHGITMAPLLLRTSHHICISISNFDSFVKLLLFDSGGERLFERDCAGADGFGMSASQDDFNKSGRKTLADILLASPTKSETEYLKLNEEKELVSEEEDCCPICFEVYDTENPKMVTKCEHEFHLSCILEWMERSGSCPVCDKVQLRTTEMAKTGEQVFIGEASILHEGVYHYRPNKSEPSLHQILAYGF